MASKTKGKSSGKASKSSSRKGGKRARKTKGYAVIASAVYRVTGDGKLSLVKKFKKHEDAVEYAMELARRMRLPVAILTKESQTGSSNEAVDARYKALPPGKRISRSGKIYYEYRRNRSDDPGGLL